MIASLSTYGCLHLAVRLSFKTRESSSLAFHDFYRLSSHAVICNAQQQVLLLKATYADQAWGLPGGALDMGKPSTRP